ncbi:MAG TPA: hybrid sensor histidine kinase/response regulator [Leptolyngbyaceae cyanobacterium M33_DOE_097]|uniref:histidine kinase n=1 Tax=Oscillatoriales cyanobacterium SpSt-418 TaxID=2282169 RepID=A0A7C3PIB9_9CYAN|nr:hybrid sensor histidine kinase/response regulator [Leptolyngbyaceae cyanobacterium M33_DOE_097]
MTHSNASILIIDDQPDNLRSLSVILERTGYSVRQAISGKIALQTAIAQPPDLILLDIRMPKMDGYAVCAALKQSPQTREIPVIFLSALEEVNDKVKAFDLGGVDYITKPFQVGEVLARINNQLQLRQQQRQLSDLLQEVQQLNTTLEDRIQAQTLELQQALQYERTLKQISDRVRDSLDKTYILQATVEELTRVLQAQCCDTELFNADRTREVICFQAETAATSAPYDSVPLLSTLPQVNEQLEQGLTFAFCRLTTDVATRCSAILGCPIHDDRTWLGTLWLFKPLLSEFTHQEICLVQQVANQCAIALRQARLYQEAQAQIQELYRLNQLKDDFLSTISHELRTPVASMQMTLELLMKATEQGQTFLAQVAENESVNNRIVQYFKILQEECQREICLIQDLLNLQYLEAGVHPLILTQVGLNEWMPHLLEPYKERIQNSQRQLIVQLAPNLPRLTTDLSCLNRILVELLNNACKYTPANELITVATHADAHYVFIRVCNSGVRIPQQELGRIFDKFYRIPNNDPWKYGGTGLGLALVRHLVNHIGGSIQVASEDNWTAFTLQFPYTP